MAAKQQVIGSARYENGGNATISHLSLSFHGMKRQVFPDVSAVDDV